MKRATTMSSETVLGEPQSFSLVLGGPLYQLLARGHLETEAPKIVQRRILVLVLLAWVPLLLLSALGGQLAGGVAVPFLLDFDVQVRFLLAMPLLIAAELIVHQRIQPLLKLFVERRMIPENEATRFARAINSALRLRNSTLVEVGLIVFVYLVGVLIIWRHYAVLSAATWYATPVGGDNELTLAGTWYAYVSLPLFQFLLCRWYFRLFVWWRLLWQISRIRLCLLPAHPDGVGGLAFVANSIHAFTPLAVAHGALLAGLIANRIFYAGARLTDFKIEIAVVVVFMLVLTIAPLLVFAPQLSQAKRLGNARYGTLAERYVRAFDAKWLQQGAPGDEQLIGSADIQSLADLAGSVDMVRNMRIVPVTRDALFRLVAATLAPLVPLALTMMPLEDLVKLLFGILV